MTGRQWGAKGQLVLVVAMVLVVWGGLGLLQHGSVGKGGYSTGLGVLVSRVEEGGPADGAGLRAGDRIVRVGNRPVTHPWAKPDRDRVKPGSAQILGIDRGGATIEVGLVWDEFRGEQWRTLLVDFVITLAFLTFGLWAFLATRSSSGFLLALLGLCYAGANFGGPSIEALDPFIRFTQFTLSFLTTVLLLHFFVDFPTRKRLFGHRVPGWMIYLPFVPFFVFGLVEVVTFPAFVSEYRNVNAYTDLLFMVLALAALIHSWITLGREERHRTRFNVVLWGLTLALGPFLILGILRLAIPGFSLPGTEFLPLLGVAIPGSMAVALVAGDRGRPDHPPGGNPPRGQARGIQVPLRSGS